MNESFKHLLVNVNAVVTYLIEKRKELSTAKQQQTTTTNKVLSRDILTMPLSAFEKLVTVGVSSRSRERVRLFI